MKEYFKIAWRNLWRNKKRTFITMSSVFFAVFLALMMRSMQLGTYDSMERNTIKNTTGYIQVHKQGYWDDKTINNTFAASASFLNSISEVPNVTQIIPRLESFALASTGILSKGVAVIGTDPEIENEVSGLAKRIIKGTYFEKGESGVLIVENLARYLKLDIGDTITLISQGYHGVTAAGNYAVRGIISFPSPAMNNKLLFMDLGTAQYLYGATNMLSSLSVMLDNPDRLNSAIEAIEHATGPDYEVMSWKEMNVELVQSIESDNISGMFMLGILYIVIGFGIFGTMMMMTLERKREFGVMVSVGMQRYKLATIIFFETIYIALISVLAGIVAASPFIYYLHVNPIRLTGEAAKAMKDFNAEPVMPFALDLPIFYNQAIVVLILTMIAVIYPLMIIRHFNILKAIRGH